MTTSFVIKMWWIWAHRIKRISYGAQALGKQSEEKSNEILESLRTISEISVEDSWEIAI